MNISTTKHFIELQKLSGKKDLGIHIIERLKKANILLVEPENEYGKTIGEICEFREVDPRDLCIYSIGVCTNDILDLFINLVVFGDAECFNCGGEVYTSGHTDDGMGDDLTPSGVEYEYTCTNCGEII
jgi:hypothetical protein